MQPGRIQLPTVPRTNREDNRKRTKGTKQPREVIASRINYYNQPTKDNQQIRNPRINKSTCLAYSFQVTKKRTPQNDLP